MNLQVFNKISYGMYIVSAKYDGKKNGQICNTVFQAAAEPPIIAISINKENCTYEMLENSGKFTVSILSEDCPMLFIGKFGFKCGRNIDKFADTNYKTGITGMPIVLDHSLAYLEVEILDKVDAVTHSIFLGKVIAAEDIQDGRPLTYAFYHEIKKGKSPKNAPTFIGM